jgi:hypothetical protein
MCSGKRVTPETSLRRLNPLLAEDWHPTKNGALQPDQVTAFSNKKVWWRCKEDPKHEWKATVASQPRERAGCPFCRGLRASEENNLAHCFPEVAAQWHPEFNNGTPDQYTAHSNKSAWWKCPVAEDHVWKTVINNLTNPHTQSGCPCCSGDKLAKDNSLLARYPEVAIEWHPTKNGEIRPEEVLGGTHEQYWWKCPVAEDHQWETSVDSRTGRRPSGCPCCAGYQLSVSNRLDILHPELLLDWEQELNGDLLPSQVFAGSEQKVWWRCDKGPDHVWQTSVKSRTGLRRSGCPACRGLQASVTNSLASLFPDIAEEWHGERNEGKTASDYSAGSGKKVWWRCAIDSNHEWKANIVDRTGKTSGCPHCSPIPHSRAEVRLAFEIHAFVPFDLNDHIIEIKGHTKPWNVDMVLRDPHRIAIEYDGVYWHNRPDALERDQRKLELLQKDGWRVIRVREVPLKPLGPFDVVCRPEEIKEAANKVLLRLQELLNTRFAGLEEYLSIDALPQQKEADLYYETLKKRFVSKQPSQLAFQFE